MTEEEICAKEAEIRQGVPEAFTHPQIKEGEIYVMLAPGGEYMGLSESILKSKGIHSARTGEEEMILLDMQKISGTPGSRRLPFTPVFANLRELIVLNDKFSKMKG